MNFETKDFNFNFNLTFDYFVLIEKYSYYLFSTV